MSITFIRHAQSEANVGGVSKPNSTIELSPVGQQQALELATQFSQKPTQVYVSEFIRTHQTAAPILDKFSLQSVILPCLNEFNVFGFDIVEGMTGAQRLPLAKRYWKACDPDANFGQGGQSFNEFCSQVRDFISLFTQGEIVDHSLVFGHGVWFSVFSWLQETNFTTSVTSAEMKEFVSYLTEHHPDNCSQHILR
ncbi:histidine phosphatase family protein [Rosenbergiella collisarenosi]|uniref:histidine phosphatase family protein n=1 Tax=Rosenbergiella collisarenosi TaxID=1544695 RepID=UPI001F4EA30F|nr:histidine phosphatase family protein [Rosenbergiella collisarenosi]